MKSILTDRQRDILILKAGGYTCTEIGQHETICLSKHGVHASLYRSYKSLGARNDVQATVIALALNIFTLDDIEMPPEVLRLIAQQNTP